MHNSYYLCTKAMTNVYSSVFLLSHRLKGEWSLWRRQGFHSTLSVSFTLRRHSTPLFDWYNLHSYLLVPMEEKVRRAHKVSVFGDSCQRGESISPKQKDCTTTNFNFKTLVFFSFQLASCIFQMGMIFSIGISFI
jgi:hypothetical protein